MKRVITVEIHKQCQFCGCDFVAKHPKARFHNDACKQKMYRWRKRLPFLYNEVERHLDGLGKYLNFPDSRPHAIALMKAAKEYINELWVNANVKVIR